ncbi:MAG: fimbrillin family protein [Prevotella sp.]|nr:fimbrillin family protein [Prevotella sp.]
MKTTVNEIKRSLVFLVCALVAAAFSGCTNDDAVQTPQPSDGDIVQVTAQVASSELAFTRGADGLNDATSKFSLLTADNASSKLNISVDNGSGTYSNFAYSITGASTIAAPATPPYFPAGVNTVHVYGWYPENGGSSTFTVQADQSTDAAYCLSDVMVAQPANCTRSLVSEAWSVTAASLTFNHIMSKIKVVVAPTAGVTITGVRLKGIKPTVALNIPAGATPSITPGTASGDAGTITLLSGRSITSASTDAAKTLCGVFPPGQSLSGNFMEIDATVGGQSSTITYSLSSAKTFAGNQQYVINATVNSISTNQTVDIGGWASEGNNPLNVTVSSQVDFGELNVQTSGSFSYAVGATNPYPSVLSVTYTRYGTTSPDAITLTSGTDYDVVYYTSNGSTTIDKASIAAAGTYYVAVVGKGTYLGAKWMKPFVIANAESGTVAVGNYLYADGHCNATASSALVSTHGAIVGVVFSTTVSNADKALGYENGYAVALQDASTSAKWSSQTSLADPGVVDLSFPYQNTMAEAELIIRGDLNGRANTANATYVGTTTAEAFYAAKNYGVNVSGFANSGWFLPSIGQFWSMCKELGQLDKEQIGNSTYSNWGSEDRTYGVWYGSNYVDKVRTKLNSYLTAAGSAGATYNYFSGGRNYGSTNVVGIGTDCTGNESFAAATYVRYWSSSEWSAGSAFGLYFDGDGSLYFIRDSAKSNTFRVRPVLAF